jgi:type VI secretion system protein ImpJ
MKVPQRVVWSEGMLVSPQHFQQQDLYHERLVDERIAALSPYRWGVVALDIDAGALGADQVSLTKFVGILPDGLFLAFEKGDPECPPARPIGAHFKPTDPMLEVFLCVPREREGVPSISDEQATAAAGLPGPGSATKAARARYRAATRAVSDLAGNAQDLTLGFALRNTAILFGDEPRDDYDSMKIAEIVRAGAGALTINETYISPIMRIDAAPFLMAGVRRLLARMMSKQRLLAGDRHQRDGSNIEFNAGDVTRFLQLCAINAAVPLMTYASTNGEISPTQLYLTLLQVVGALSTFSPDVDPSKLPMFNHTDLRATFEELFARVTAVLHAVREAYISVPIEISQGVHVGRLEDDRLLTASHYLLGIKSDHPEEQLSSRLPGLCKIASPDQLKLIMRAATPGVPIQVTHRPPAEIPIRAGVVYFALNLQNDYWRQIAGDRAIAVYLPPPFDPSRVKLELMAVPRAGM